MVPYHEGWSAGFTEGVVPFAGPITPTVRFHRTHGNCSFRERREWHDDGREMLRPQMRDISRRINGYVSVDQYK